MKNKTKSLKLNAVFNIIKQCCNVLFPLITYPYVSRILGSARLGKYSFADSVISYFILTAMLGNPTYAIREGSRIREDKDGIEKFSSEVFSINLLAALISYAVLVLCTLSVTRLQDDVILLVILSFNIIAQVLGRDWLNSIYEDFFYISLRYIVFQMIALVLIFLFVKTPDDYVSYTAIMLLANAGGYFANIFYTRKYVKLKVTRHLNLKKHLKPLLILFSSSVAITIYIHSDITILGFMRSDSEVGIYTLSSKVYTIVKGLLNAVIMVTIPRLANHLGRGEHEKYESLCGRLYTALITLVLPCVVGMFCMSPEIMYLIGGKEYVSGADSLRILCGALFFAVYGCYYANAILIPLRKEKIFFIATVISAVLNIVLNILIIPYTGINGAALTTLLAEFIVMMITRHYAKNPEASAKKKLNLKSVIPGCAGIAAVCYLMKLLPIPKIPSLLLTVLLAAVLYAGVLLLMKNEFAQELLQSAKARGQRLFGRKGRNDAS